MDIEEINVWIEKNRNGSDLVDHIDHIDWMIAEVERLNTEYDIFKKLYYDCDAEFIDDTKKIAIRCVEIAIEVSESSISVRWHKACGAVISGIKREFKL